MTSRAHATDSDPLGRVAAALALTLPAVDYRRARLATLHGPLHVWPAFAAWMIDGMTRNVVSSEKLTAAFGELVPIFVDAQSGGRVAPVDIWRRYRLTIWESGREYRDLVRGNYMTANAWAELRPELGYVENAVESACDAAWAMYADRWEADAASLAVIYAGLAAGWWSAQAEWAPKMPLQAVEYWRPAVALGRERFAMVASLKLLDLCGA